MNLIGKITSYAFLLTSTSLGGIILHSSRESTTIGKEFHTQYKKDLLNERYKEWKSLIRKYRSSNQETSPRKIKDWDLPTEGKPKIPFIKKCTELWNTRIRDVPKTEDRERIKEDLGNWCVTNPSALNPQ